MYKTGSEASLGELVRALAEEGSGLAKAELNLVQARVKVRARAASVAVALLAVAGLFGLIFLIAFMIGLCIWLAGVTDSAAVGTFLVALLNLILAGIAVLIAKRKINVTTHGVDTDQEMPR